MTFAKRLERWKDGRIYVYGAGDCGLHARRMLEERFGHTVAGFLDTYKRGTFDGLPVEEPHTALAGAPAGTRVLVASEYWREIAAMLDACDFPGYEVASWASLTWRSMSFFRDKLATGPEPSPQSRKCTTAPAAPGSADSADTPPLAPLAPMLSVPFHDNCLVDLPLTEHCNLRCGYCPHHMKKGYDWKDTEAWLVDSVHKMLEPYGRVRIELGGGQGETTLLKDWQKRADSFLARGGRLRITTNLARELRWDEAETLSRFYKISVSIDTIDSAILKAVRLGASAAKIVFNIAQIKAAAAAAGREPPEFNIQAVVSDRTVHHVEGVVALAAALDLKNVRFISLINVPFDQTLNNITVLSPDEARDAVAAFERAFQIGLDHNIAVDVDDNVSDVLLHCLSRDSQADTADEPVRILVPTEVPAGMTRLCYEPWIHLIFVYNGDAFSCCYGNPRFRPDYESGDIAAVFDAEPMRELRRRLLEGDLDALCTRCVAKPLIPADQYRRKVDAFLRSRPPLD